jgi:RHS repeat-associated protein
MKHRLTDPSALRRARAPIAFVTCAAFLWTLAGARPVRAEMDPTESMATPEITAPVAVNPQVFDPGDIATVAKPIPSELSKASDSPPAIADLAPAGATDFSKTAPFVTDDKGVVLDDVKVPPSIPKTANKTGVSAQAISLPQGAGKIRGLGESFTAQLSTGIATWTIPIELPSARGGVQPELALSYASTSGSGNAGLGWDLSVPFIARQTDRGTPRYKDPAVGGPWLPKQDRFVFNGGQELVPICTVPATECNALTGEVMPPWATGWHYFRPRVEGSFLRFFWSADHRTWRVQSKDGATMELGVPQDGSEYLGALETDPSSASRIFRWNLVREYDAQRDGTGRPVNLVAYRYKTAKEIDPAQTDSALAYLTDVYDTPPRSSPAEAALSTWAHHVRLVYETRTDPTTSFRRGWPTTHALRLASVDVASKSFAGDTASARELVRRYRLSYSSAWHVSYLTRIELEGRCSAPVSEGSGEALPATTSCPTLPAASLFYQHVDGYDTKGASAPATIPTFEAFDARIRAMNASPPFSLDDEMTDLFDVNADGLPDVVSTAAAFFDSKHGVWFGGAAGSTDTFSMLETMRVEGVLGADAAVISLKNPNVVSADLDGNGVVDLLHMPKVKTYAVYSPVQDGEPKTWRWRGRTASVPELSANIDFTKDATDLRVVDVDGDGLVDVVRTTASAIETYFALGRFPGGDGRYGQGEFASASTATLSSEPVKFCLPWSGTPVRFSDETTKLADLNGDGLPDLVKVDKGRIIYWPGRGNGFFGTGLRDGCAAGTFAADRAIEMKDSPWFTDPSPATVRLDDVNGDGLDDLLQVRFADVDIWLNVDGAGWSTRQTIAGTPVAPALTARVRLVDINGSGTRDLLWGDAGSYQYIDLLGGKRPGLLVSVDNGLGRTTTLDYASSTELMVAASPKWSTRSPTVAHVVVRETVREGAGIAGEPARAYVTEYGYADPIYDGLQREFRGFRRVTVTALGDDNSPTSSNETTFDLGECKASPTDPTPLAGCPTTLWEDNPREALKGLPGLSETRDVTGVHLSTVHHGYVLRKLYAGLDGRAVRWAFAANTDTFLYDVAGWSADASETLDLTAVEGDRSETRKVTLRSRTGRARVRSTSVADDFGNAYEAIDHGCTHGCTPLDEPIKTYTRASRVGSDGWNFRTVESWVTGAGTSPEKRNHTSLAYDTFGNLTETTATLGNTLPLDRRHEDGSALFSSSPPNGSVPGTISITKNTRDEFGNVILLTSPGSRCSSLEYDTTYGDLVVRELVYTGFPAITRTFGTTSASCGPTELSSSATYDRGLEMVTGATGLQGDRMAATYDGFGRVTAIWRPHPSAAGALSPQPSIKVEYLLGAPASRIHSMSQDGAKAEDAVYRDEWTYVDGLGRPIATLSQADSTAGDEGDWIVSGVVDFDGKGGTRRAYRPWFWSGDPATFAWGVRPTSSYQRVRYDAFGRTLELFATDTTPVLTNMFHALSVDSWDAEDRAPGPHYGTPTTTVTDGHGRTVATIEHVHAGTAIEARETRTTYLPTGEPLAITRSRPGSTPVVRWMRYDTLGRLVLNVEPNTSTGFVSDPLVEPVPTTLRAWRYAYDDAGELVGTSDARGCGTDYHYDTGGRLIAEDYSPCLRTHANYSSPTLTPELQLGTEVLNRFDKPITDAEIAAIRAEDPTCTFDSNPSAYNGRLTSTLDRAQRTVFSYDGRGRIICVARQIAKPGPASNDPATRYAPRWYVQVAQYDASDRAVATSTGSKLTELAGSDGKSIITTAYAANGKVRSIGGSYGALVTAVDHDADGAALSIAFGDAAKTRTAFEYDARRRLSRLMTYRVAPTLWSSSTAYLPGPTYGSGVPTTHQEVLENLEYAYDLADNPIEIRDGRTATEWPSGAKPVNRAFQYDDLYRVTLATHDHGSDTWISPFAHENVATTLDPRLALPSPHVSFDRRVAWQSFAYDWLGNTVTTDDDAKGFYDRSLGTITNGTATAAPYRLLSASNVGATGGRTGKVSTAYDGAGALVSVVVERSGPCLPVGAVCSHRYAYEWDEVGRLVRARRWDLATPGLATSDPPTTTPAVELRYAYDGGDQRVLKTAVDPTAAERHTLYVFPSLELRRTTWSGSEYARGPYSEVPYLFANGQRLARVAYEDADVPSFSSEPNPRLHVFLELGDHLGSTSTVIDVATGELVEKAGYQAYGATESDYRPARWKSFREDHRFTGKEDDVEIGLTYFGFRWYAPQLGRWISADPLTVHGLDADMNVYAYVRGRTSVATDPMGLKDKIPSHGIYKPKHHPPPKSGGAGSSAGAGAGATPGAPKAAPAPTGGGGDKKDGGSGGTGSGTATGTGTEPSTGTGTGTTPGTAKIERPGGLEGLGVPGGGAPGTILGSSPPGGGGKGGAGGGSNGGKNSFGFGHDSNSLIKLTKEWGAFLAIVATIMDANAVKGMARGALKAIWQLGKAGWYKFAASHVYELRWVHKASGASGVFKYGISSAATSVKGFSLRGMAQVRAWNKVLRGSGYELQHGQMWGLGKSGMNMNKGQALWAEQFKVTEHSVLKGFAPPGNQLPKPWTGTVIPPPP